MPSSTSRKARRAKTPAEVVKAIGYALFGEPGAGAKRESHWVTLLGRALGKSRFVVNRWATGETVPDVNEWLALRDLLRQRREVLGQLDELAKARATSAAVTEKRSAPPL